jgi:hypothetical protein
LVFLEVAVSANPTPKGLVHLLIPIEDSSRMIEIDGLSREVSHIIYSIPFAEKALAKRKIFEDF